MRHGRVSHGRLKRYQPRTAMRFGCVRFAGAVLFRLFLFRPTGRALAFRESFEVGFFDEPVPPELLGGKRPKMNQLCNAHSGNAQILRGCRGTDERHVPASAKPNAKQKILLENTISRYTFFACILRSLSRCRSPT